MTESERIRRPVPPRRSPKRSILGALKQSDGNYSPQQQSNGESHGETHPLGNAFGSSTGHTAKPEDRVDETGSSHFIDHAVRSASDLIDEQIRQGQDAARSLNRAGSSGIGTSAMEASVLLEGVIRACGELSKVWIESIGSLSSKPPSGSDKVSEPSAEQPANSFALHRTRLRTSRSAELELEIFRPAQELSVQPLVCFDNGKCSILQDVHYEPAQSGMGGCVCVFVPPDQTAGIYRGLLTASPGATPAGVLTVVISGEAQTGSSSS